MGCRLCEVYCQVQHSPSKDIIKVFKREVPPLPRLRVENRRPVSFSVRCQHCEDAPLHLGAIRQDRERGKAVKCDLCPEADIPACVANCPNEALVYEEVEAVAAERL